MSAVFPAIYQSDIPYIGVVSQYGADPDGTTDCCPAIVTAKAAHPTRELFFSTGTYRLHSANLVINNACTFEDGAILKPESGRTITINGVIHAGALQQIIDLSLGGTVTFGPKACARVSVGWFGAKADGATDATTAFQQAVTAVQNSVTGACIYIPHGQYYLTGTIRISADFTEIVGDGENVTQITFNPSSDIPLFLFRAYDNLTAINSCRVEGMAFYGFAGNTHAKTAIQWVNQSHCTVQNVNVHSTWTSNGGSLPSVGIKTQGHEFLSILHSLIWADRPIWIDKSVVPPYYGGQFDCDHFHFADLELYPQVTTEAAIYITPGVLVTNLNIDGFVSLIGGKYGIYFPSVPSPVLTDPAVVAATSSTLTAATYYYTVTALIDTGESQPAVSGANANHNYVSAVVAVSNVSGVTLSWSAVAGATKYYVYRTAVALPAQWYLEHTYFDVGTATTFVDHGQAPTGVATGDSLTTGRNAPGISGYNWHIENARREQDRDGTGFSFWIDSHAHFIRFINVEAAGGTPGGFRFRNLGWTILQNCTYDGSGIALDFNTTNDRIDLDSCLLFGTQSLGGMVAHAAFGKRADNQQAQSVLLGSIGADLAPSTILGKLGLGIDQPQPGGNGWPAFGLDVVGGGIKVRQVASPAAPTVVPTGGAAGSYTYTIVARDRAGGFTQAGPSTTITNGPTTLDATHFNTISWPAVPGAVSYDVLTQDTTHYLVVALTATSYVDSGQTVNAYGSPPSRNTTGDLTVDGRINTDNLFLPTAMGAGQSGVSGTVNLNKGGATTTGYVSFSKIDGTRLGYMGFSTQHIQLVLENAAKFIVSGGPLVLATSSPPASATANGTTGQVAYDSSFFYVCVATNTWVRTALATW